MMLRRSADPQRGLFSRPGVRKGLNTMRVFRALRDFVSDGPLRRAAALDLPIAGDAPSAEDADRAVSRLGRYLLVAELARGRVATVRLGQLRGSDGFSKLLAIKELRQDLVRDESVVRRFIQEARLAARLNHQNVVQTVEMGSEGSRIFVAMEFLDGQPLHRIVQSARARGLALPLHAHRRIILDVLAGLEYVHGLADLDATPLGLVHRDVAPHSVFVTYQGQTKLIDFAMAMGASQDRASQDAAARPVAGRAKYMAPERALGGPVDRRGDIYAVGVMLCEAILGRHPWGDASDDEVLERLRGGAVPSVRAAGRGVDPHLAAIVERATCPISEGRYKTAAAMRRDLERVTIRQGQTPGWPVDVVPSRTNVRASLSNIVADLFADERRKLAEAIKLSRASGPGEDESRTSSVPPFALTMTTSAPSPPRVDLGPAFRGPSVAEALPHAPRPATPPEQPAEGSAAAPRRVQIYTAAAVLATILAMLAITLFDSAPTSGAASSEMTVSPNATIPATTRPPVTGSRGPMPMSIPIATASAGTTTPTLLSAAPSPAPKRRVRVTVRVAPPSAVLELDGDFVSNPYVAEREVDFSPHDLHVRAPGYVASSYTIAFDVDRSYEIDLERTWDTANPPGAPRASVPTSRALRRDSPAVGPDAQSTAVAPASNADDRPPVHMARELDKTNPYAP
jgi:eukaryotic-like serine/threonine-protein kinase